LKPYQVKECGGSTNPCAHTASSKASSGQCCGTCCSRDPLLHTRARCPRLVDPLSERDCGLTNGAFAYRWWPCTMAFHILELYKLMPLLYVAQKGKHCTNFSRLVFNKRKWRRRLQGTDTALQIRKPPKRVDVHIGKGRRARLTRSMRTRTK
jgi:hypothetical protein